MGDDLSEKNIIPNEFHNVLITKWTEILQKVLNKETLEELLKKYSFPTFFEAIHPPIINTKFKHMLVKSGIKKDDFQVVAQEEYFQLIKDRFGKFEIDWFTTNINRKFKRFIS